MAALSASGSAQAARNSRTAQAPGGSPGSRDASRQQTLREHAPGCQAQENQAAFGRPGARGKSTTSGAPGARWRSRQQAVSFHASGGEAEEGSTALAGACSRGITGWWHEEGPRESPPTYEHGGRARDEAQEARLNVDISLTHFIHRLCRRRRILGRGIRKSLWTRHHPGSFKGRRPGATGVPRKGLAASRNHSESSPVWLFPQSRQLG